MTPDERFTYLLTRTARLQDQVEILWQFAKKSDAWLSLPAQKREEIYREYFEYNCNFRWSKL